MLQVAIRGQVFRASMEWWMCRMIKKMTSRDYILASIREIMDGDTVDQMTVAEICSRAGVSRTTFYKLFTSKYAAAYHAFSRELGRTMPTGDLGLRQLVEGILVDIDGNRSYYGNVVKSPEVLRVFIEHAICYCEAYVTARMGDAALDEARARDVAAASRDLGLCLYGVILEWVISRPACSARERADDAVAFCEGGLRGMLGCGGLCDA